MAQFSKNVAIGGNLSDTSLLSIRYVNTESGPKYGVKSELLTASANISGPIYGVYSVADAFSMTYNYPIYQIVGVYGKSLASSSVHKFFSAGVAGVANYYNGIGVYGAIGTEKVSLPTSSKGATYAGYFDGPVKIASTLSAAVISTTSDIRLKDNIHVISESDIDNLEKLRPVKYLFRRDTMQFVYLDGVKETRVEHYGLIAQDVQKIYPELVYEDGNGFMSINYTELIPLLVGKINSLSEQVEFLTKRLSNGDYLLKKQKVVADKEEAILYQNTPNPFDQSATIEYFLPQLTSNATIYIYDMQGQQIAEYPVTEYGEGSIRINGGIFKAGIYLYSLIADNQLIDTKQMIITK